MIPASIGQRIARLEAKDGAIQTVDIAAVILAARRQPPPLQSRAELEAMKDEPGLTGAMARAALRASLYRGSPTFPESMHPKG